MSKSTLRQHGYIALLAVLIVGAASLAIASVLLLTASDSQRTTLISQESAEARSLASSCAEEGLQQIQANNSFTGTNNLSLGQGSCTYTVTNTGGVNRSISASGTVGTTVRRVAVAASLGASTISITSWQDTSGGSPATIAHVQSNGLVDGPSTTSIAQTFSSNVTAGSLIVAAVVWDPAGSVNTITCSDNRGNGYSTVNVWIDNINSQALGICYAPNAAAGSTTVTATYGSGSVSVNFRRIIISEYSGVATVSPLDVNTGVGGSAGTTSPNGVTSGAATTSQNGDLIYGAVEDTDGTTTIAAGTGFTQRYSLNSKEVAVQDLQQATAGSVASTQTFGAVHRYDAAMVAFKAQLQ